MGFLYALQSAINQERQEWPQNTTPQREARVIREIQRQTTTTTMADRNFI